MSQYVVVWATHYETSHDWGWFIPPKMNGDLVGMPSGWHLRKELLQHHGDGPTSPFQAILGARGSKDVGLEMSDDSDVLRTVENS